MNSDPLDTPLIQRLVSLADDEGRERIFVCDLVQALEERAVVALILLFALPNVVPVPPGTSAILGAPLLFLTLEWALGMAPWLPRLLARRSIARTDFAAMVRRARPWLVRVGNMPEPRLHARLGPLATRLVAALCVVLALIILLPIPFGNMPPAWSISLIALGMLRRDGAWVLLGIATGLVSIALVWAVTLSLVSGVLDALQRTWAA
jgi:hypothetical protein